ncbi:hypothetical protein [Mesorhizobium sp. M0139]|uniref:hypothetical protein n=1 Tax=Mesorhizobium sp. M0139 TaxID=2956892 RepID=UPI003339E728
MNDAITWSSVLAFITVAGALAGAGGWLYSQIMAVRRDVEKLREDNALRFAAVAQVISDFKLEVARNYATNSSIREVEERVVQAIERLGDRLDKFLDNRTVARS